MYQPTIGARSKPRTLILEGSWIAIGGTVTVTPEPPKLPRIIPEATASQYKTLYEAGFTHLVEVVPDIIEAKTEETNVAIRYADTKAASRRKRNLSTVPKV